MMAHVKHRFIPPFTASRWVNLWIKLKPGEYVGQGYRVEDGWICHTLGYNTAAQVVAAYQSHNAICPDRFVQFYTELLEDGFVR